MADHLVSRRGLPILLILGLSAAGLTAATPEAAAQSQYSDACETAFGICRVPPRVLGTYCECYGDRGVIVPPPPPPAEPDPWEVRPDVPVSDACATPYGICRVPPGPLGSYCSCFGDSGERVPPPPPRF